MKLTYGLEVMTLMLPFTCSSVGFLRCVYIRLLWRWPCIYFSSYSDLTHNINQEKEIILMQACVDVFSALTIRILGIYIRGCNILTYCRFSLVNDESISVTCYYTVFSATCWVYFQYLMQVRLDYRLTWILSMFKCQIEMQPAEDKSEVICGFSASLSLVSSELCNSQHS